MFALHERTKIWLCRLAFVATGVVPTCAIGVAAVAIRLPAYRSAHERELAARLGCDVRIGAVTLPRPGTTRYERLEVIDAQRNQLLARVPRVELRGDDERLEVDLAAGAIANGGRLDAFWRVADELVGRFHDPLEITIAAERFTLHQESGDVAFHSIDGHLAIGRDESRLALQGRLAAAQLGGEPVELTIIGRRGAERRAARCRWPPGRPPYPARWPCRRGPRPSGWAARFLGQMAIDQLARGTKVELSGRLMGVQLEPLVRPLAPHRLSGLANVNIDQATIVDGRIVSAAGNLAAGPGAISRSLVESAETALGMKPAGEATAHGDRHDGLRSPGPGLRAGRHERGRGRHGRSRARGRADAWRPGAGARSDSPRRDVVALVRLLAPPATQRQMPVARQTDWLARVLPLAPASGDREQAAPARR